MNVKTPYQREEERVGKMENLLREIRDSYIGDPKNQGDIEKEWCQTIDKLLEEEPCGLFTLDFRKDVSITSVDVQNRGDAQRVEMTFTSHDEAEIAVEQLGSLLRATNEIYEISKMESGFSQAERFMKLAAKVRNLRHGEVEI